MTSSNPAGSSILEFIETCIFTYLHNRKIYAAHTFDRRRAFDLIVYRSRQTELVSYIEDSLRSVQDFLQNGELQQLCAVLADRDGNVAERLDFLFIKSGAAQTERITVIPKDFARATLIRLMRLQLPDFLCTEFSLAFEVFESSIDGGRTSSDEKLITRDQPRMEVANERVKKTTIPIVTIPDSGSGLKLCIKLETSLL